MRSDERLGADREDGAPRSAASVPPQSRKPLLADLRQCPTARSSVPCTLSWMLAKRVQSKSPVSVTLPPSALPWPPMYLVKRVDDQRHLDRLLGGKRYGEVMVLSTT